MLWVSLMAAVLISQARADISDGAPRCTHRWNNDATGVPAAGKTGADAAEGIFDCEIVIAEKDHLSDKFIYVAEVGDASYFRLVSINGKQSHPFVFSHGMWPADDERSKSGPRYSRFLPFVVAVERIWSEAGVYRFEIHYRDVIAWQRGIHASPVAKESFLGCLVRFTFGNRRLVWLSLQFIYFVLALFFAFFFRSGIVRRDAAVALSMLFAALSMLQLTGVFRYFFPIQFALVLLFSVQLVTFAAFGVGLESLIREDGRSVRAVSRGVFFATLATIPLAPLLVDQKIGSYQLVFGPLFFISGPCCCLIAAYLLLSKKAVFLDSSRPSRVRGLCLTFVGGMFLADLLNWIVLRRNHEFVSHYVYFSSIVTIFLYSQIALRLHSLDYIRRLRAIGAGALSRLSVPDTSTYQILSEMSAEFGRLFSAQRVSIVEIIGQKVRLLGAFGEYSDPRGIFDIRENSILYKLTRQKTLQRGLERGIIAPHLRTEYWVIPLFSNGVLLGGVCLTDFEHGFLMPFFERRIETFRNEVESCIHYLFSRRDSLVFESVIQIERQRLNPLLIQSEEYLLKNFLVAEEQRSYSFMMGDLVGSVSLREVFGNDAVDGAIEECLTSVWRSGSQLGLVIDVREGDSFSITAPMLVGEPSEGHVARCLVVLNQWNGGGETFREIARRHGITADLEFRVVMGIAVASERGRAFKRFDYDANPAKDTAARVLKEVCLPGECVVIGREAAGRLPQAEVYALEGKRLRGKKVPTDLFVLKKPTTGEAAA